MKTIIKILLWLILLILMATVLRGIIEKTMYFIYPLEYEETITEYANENGLDIYYVMAVIKAESNYDPKAHSGKARGLMQITDDTALEPRIGMLEKFHGIFEYDVREVDRLSQIYEQKRDNRIIIDQIDFGNRFLR